MASRTTRTATVLRNRSALLAAARRVFLERGFHGATLEAIALEAGFSKGVVYSQFDSKADLFLALLEQRQAERASDNSALARPGSGAEGLLELMRHWETEQEEQLAWTLLVMEFRVHAARDATLSARYAHLHERTIDGVVGVLETVWKDRPLPPLPLRTIVVLVLALGSGIALERTGGAADATPEEIAALLGPALGRASAPAAPLPSTATKKRRKTA